MIAASIGNPDHFDKNEVLVRRRDGLFASAAADLFARKGAKPYRKAGAKKSKRSFDSCLPANFSSPS
uniref:hypothetical protein n=1 Tax=Algoriphagus sp. TaxID=1872435 RepID=UPI0040483A1B